MLKVLKKRILRRKKGNEDVQVEARKLATARETLERYSEAVAFAEAGLQDAAQEIVRKGIQESHKILVVGNEDSFSRPLIEYAVGFAKRMGYEIVAMTMNSMPFGQEAPKVLSPFQEKVCENLERSASGGAELLMCRAAEQGVPCQHVVRFGPMDRCIRDLHNEIRRVEFVLTEPEASPEERMEPAIPVFCLAE